MLMKLFQSKPTPYFIGGGGEYVHAALAFNP